MSVDSPCPQELTVQCEEYILIKAVKALKINCVVRSALFLKETEGADLRGKVGFSSVS